MFKETSLCQIVDKHIVPCEFDAEDGQYLCVAVAHIFHSVKEKEQLLHLLKAAGLTDFGNNRWCYSALMVSAKVPSGHMLTIATHDGEIELTKFNALVKQAINNKKYAGPEGRARLARIP